MTANLNLRSRVLRRTLITVFIGALSLLAACSSGPEPIVYGTDSCDYCRMGITDQRYGTELVSVQGKNYKFDSIECLAGFVASERISPTDVGSLWVTCYDNPSSLTDATTVTFIRSDELLSPMAMNFTAFSADGKAQVALDKNGGERYTWSKILETVKTEGFVR